MAFLASIGVLLVLFGLTVLVIGSVRHFFPFVEDYIPQEFKKPLSIQFSAYYLLAGLLLILIQPT
ncbi:hypothetical protein [Thiothrix nivea]|uniref:Uncharacterized protein n=1 Tax=Thiothrix nivea (strain ATCC 35100 / DSM 5205 / JP2) TaxID=870187 RepID=A0A656HIH6_THINJ|nr:hypothetical protein [Thiothrix nivea]EIJ36257.1 hypothetical protein Thini_3755 [Thiothrix nivea DSM 5205]